MTTARRNAATSTCEDECRRIFHSSILLNLNVEANEALHVRLSCDDVIEVDEGVAARSIVREVRESNLEPRCTYTLEDDPKLFIALLREGFAFQQIAIDDLPRQRAAQDVFGVGQGRRRHSQMRLA